MLTAKETAIHLENLRRSHEITRALRATWPIRIVLRREHHCWTSNGVPLPFHVSATPDQVAAFVGRRAKQDHGSARKIDITVHV